MADWRQGERVMSVADRVGKLCRRYGDGELDQLPPVAADALARILALVRAGTPGEALVPDLDLIDAALAGDVKGLTAPTRVFHPVAGMGGHPEAYVAVCPNRICSRRVVRTSAAGLPDMCEITGQPLELIQLPT
jgi:hypothetical protein